MCVRSPHSAPRGCCAKGLRRGVAQMVARLLWEQEVPGSNPGTPTSRCLGGMDMENGAMIPKQYSVSTKQKELAYEFLVGLARRKGGQLRLGTAREGNLGSAEKGQCD